MPQVLDSLQSVSACGARSSEFTPHCASSVCWGWPAPSFPRQVCLPLHPTSAVCFGLPPALEVEETIAWCESVLQSTATQGISGAATLPATVRGASTARCNTELFTVPEDDAGTEFPVRDVFDDPVDEGVAGGATMVDGAGAAGPRNRRLESLFDLLEHAPDGPIEFDPGELYSPASTRTVRSSVTSSTPSSGPTTNGERLLREHRTTTVAEVPARSPDTGSPGTVSTASHVLLTPTRAPRRGVGRDATPARDADGDRRTAPRRRLIVTASLQARQLAKSRQRELALRKLQDELRSAELAECSFQPKVIRNVQRDGQGATRDEDGLLCGGCGFQVF